MSFFDRAFDFVLANEGGFSNDPVDRGGATNWGITQADLSRWRKKLVTIDEVRALKKDEAKAIYREFYWDKLRLDEVDDKALAIAVFDQAVNRGAVTAAKHLQSVLGVQADGKIGPQTIEALEKRNPRTVLYDFVKAAQISYSRIVQGNPSQSRFLVGWINRTHRLLDLIL